MLTKNATEDLESIHNYISEILKEKNVADNYMDTIRRSIISLDEMPLRYKVIETEPFKSMNMRRVLVKNFYIYYSVDETNNLVNIHGVIYARRDQGGLFDR